ncbi:HHK17, histidine kinase-group VII protein [Amylocarpus encephaloides]|uniref:histidine kinase n=1 Tax=Amylocarpus encephaloides TaxID=45428 RepID=A0A9P7YSF9_9HELO|nr:HHK17, histidine kinase-group VII protein [Amylocarpus encephaloides]
MEGGLHASQTDPLINRDTLCLPDFATYSILHGGDERFNHIARQYFPTAESNATERLVSLKARLRNAPTPDFWSLLMEEICDITGSQCGFVVKRMLVDDQDSAVELPELGAPGSCLKGVAFYVNNGVGVKEMYPDCRFHAHGTLCAHMKHDKVLIIPERLTEIVPGNPFQMPGMQSEAFIGLPLFNEGKNLAHVGLIWSSNGAPKRKLGWSFIEMLLHSLEDMILSRILDGRGCPKEVISPATTPAKAIPLPATTASQSLKPYARSLSHELRTPMQGVVGMLDIMHSTILDAISNQQSDGVPDVLLFLKNHVETVQDSSRRAIEAADNVVHAYDLNMQMPASPLTTPDSIHRISCPTVPSTQPRPWIESSPLRSPKRARHDEDDRPSRPRAKRRFTITEAEIRRKYYPDEAIPSCGLRGQGAATTTTRLASPQPDGRGFEAPSPPLTPATLSAGHRRVVTREFMQGLLKEAVRNGHPTSQVRTESELGETIEVKNLGAGGEVQERRVSLKIAVDVPDVIIVEESQLQFALQKVVDNAIKFTDTGSITITMKMARTLPLVEIWVMDTGCGIAEASRSRLFTPHFQEDASIQRSRDGLGLSLFNAKAHVRKNLGGDVTLERSATEGPSKGSEFLIRLPISTLDLGNLDAPLVGTPPNDMVGNGTLPAGLPTPGLDLDMPTKAPRFATSGATMIPSGPPSRLISKTQDSPRRPAFNQQLARQYPLNILIAEDNAINRNVAVGSLNKLGYVSDSITVAFDGVEAVEQYKRSLLRPPEERFDLVLMDIWMPNMDGFQAATKILDLASNHGANTKVVAVTADITAECLFRTEETGMQGFLAKPYKVLDFEGLIMEHFQELAAR